MLLFITADIDSVARNLNVPFTIIVARYLKEKSSSIFFQRGTL
ncbi:MAG: hypothetical protein ACTSUT_16830 [Promethearchaeota archaeon]